MEKKQNVFSRALLWLAEKLLMIIFFIFMGAIGLLFIGDNSSENKKQILAHIKEHSRCTRRELSSYVKLRKPSLDLDDLLESLVSCHELVLDADEQGEEFYRLPNSDDLRKWWLERLDRYGIQPEDEVLEELFTADLNNEGCCGHLEVAFCLKRGNVYFFGKEFAPDCRTEVFWHKEREKKTFASFDEMMDSPFLGGRSIRSLLPDILLTEVNSCFVDSWIAYYLYGNENCN